MGRFVRESKSRRLMLNRKESKSLSSKLLSVRSGWLYEEKSYSKYRANRLHKVAPGQENHLAAKQSSMIRRNRGTSNIT